MTVNELMMRIEKQGLKANDDVPFVCSLGPPTVTWTTDDILQLRPDWTQEQAKEWLDVNCTVIQGTMCDSGWSCIEELLAADGM